ncbi:peptide/nickel transport system ATP-binding protein/peptide/nickel transport system ATP-binding protein [Prauserella shujinwangii]|uniref:Peptide/nickel transport system ATP-binding protein/peptide/nickel transport system ATP-binding protein n=1 Tax=Prauserella shujinwangii TaxID=1453103 RepID=A0A2T0LY41_9PSEU|nr:ABC transporter ATP-binding protein [Prauserella shujinwangii]PRX49029.1 peptide/nickel transport system ATP-binding protein/peptide/nickel transport system ATP-binding protein [Prauserella shujinwangii]
MSTTDPTATTADPVLEVADLNVQFPTDDGLVQAVRGVNYTLRRGEVLGIVGESGSGKSVTSLAVMGLLPGTARISGSVRFQGRELLESDDKELSKVRGRGISMVFQDPMTSLNPVYTIGDQIAEAIMAHHDIRKDAARKQAVELLDLVRIPHPEQRANAYPHELSGGMRQRVVIAIAMANRPDVIIADEPTTALDVTVQAQILEALRTAQQETGAAMILITHDLGVIAGQADRVLVMYAGKVVEAGTADEVFYTPRMPYTLGLLGSLPRLDVKTDRLTPIAGSPPSVVNMPPGCPFSPRCPLAQDICETEEPALEPGPNPDHLGACHFSYRVEGHEPGDLFSEQADDATPLPAGTNEGEARR